MSAAPSAKPPQSPQDRADATEAGAPASLGALIRQYRLARGWTGEKLDVEAQISWGITSALESHPSRRAHSRTIWAIASALVLSDAQTSELLRYAVAHNGRASATAACPSGALLRRYRAGSDWSVSDLARQAGCSASALTRIESGERIPSVSMIAKMASALELSPAEHDRMLILAGHAPTEDPDIKRAVWLLCGDGVPTAVRDALSTCIREAVAVARVER